VEWPRHNKEYRPRLGEFDGFLDRICIFHPQGKHKTWDCDRLHGFVDEVLKVAKWDDQEKKPEEPKCDFPEANKEVSYINGGPNSYESRRKQKLIAREVMAVSPTTPEYIKWSEVPITFDHSNHPYFVPKLGRYPLIVSPIIRVVRLNRVLVDGGSFLSILFLKTFDQMGFSRSLPHPSRAPFHDIISSVAATPVGQISLPMTFGTRENFRTETVQFEVTDFKTAYNAFLGWSAPLEFMAIPQYAYLVLKMPGPRGIISIRGDVKWAFDCDMESSETVDRLTAFAELQELNQALAESPPDLIMPKAKTSKTPTGGHTQQDDSIVYGGAFQGCSRRHQFGSKIGTHAHQIPPGK
jgi:hypothetical protein